MESYDSKEDTLEHIDKVRYFLNLMTSELHKRGVYHDNSKLMDPEKEIFDEFTPKLKGLTYGSEEYKSALRAMKPALDHHYRMNTHHPEHYENGVDGMDLLNLIEMICDWKAATLRHADGDIERSLEINKERFGISDQLFSIFKNTVHRYFS